LSPLSKRGNYGRRIKDSPLTENRAEESEGKGEGGGELVEGEGKINGGPRSCLRKVKLVRCKR